MSRKFSGSIAQKHVQFPIETVIEPLAGENYTRAMIFIPVVDAGSYLTVSNPQAGTIVELTSSNYGALALGELLGWLTPFFKSAVTAKVGIAFYDEGESATKTLQVVYEKLKMYAYFKFALKSAKEAENLQLELAKLCLPDPLYSDCWIGTHDELVLTGASNFIKSLTHAKVNARVIYNPDHTINPALAQLGRTLSSVNATGTAVGNSTDMVAFATIGASGKATETGKPTNLDPIQCAKLDEQKIGYNSYVGDGTDNVVTEGSLTLQGESVGANWVKNYITYMCKVKTANYIAKMNSFRNNSTYQGILLILTDIVSGFLKMGRLDNFVLTAPNFADLPKSGDTITVPNAWSARFIDSVRAVTVFGTLYITQPTR